MKHIKTITTPKADVFSDFFNAVFRAFQNFIVAKKNELF